MPKSLPPQKTADIEQRKKHLETMEEATSSTFVQEKASETGKTSKRHRKSHSSRQQEETAAEAESNQEEPFEGMKEESATHPAKSGGNECDSSRKHRLSSPAGEASSKKKRFSIETADMSDRLVEDSGGGGDDEQASAKEDERRKRRLEKKEKRSEKAEKQRLEESQQAEDTVGIEAEIVGAEECAEEEGGTSKDKKKKKKKKRARTEEADRCLQQQESADERQEENARASANLPKSKKTHASGVSDTVEISQDPETKRCRLEQLLPDEIKKEMEELEKTRDERKKASQENYEDKNRDTRKNTLKFLSDVLQSSFQGNAENKDYVTMKGQLEIEDNIQLRKAEVIMEFEMTKADVAYSFDLMILKKPHEETKFEKLKEATLKFLERKRDVKLKYVRKEVDADMEVKKWTTIEDDLVKSGKAVSMEVEIMKVKRKEELTQIEDERDKKLDKIDEEEKALIGQLVEKHGTVLKRKTKDAVTFLDALRQGKEEVKVLRMKEELASGEDAVLSDEEVECEYRVVKLKVETEVKMGGFLTVKGLHGFFVRQCYVELLEIVKDEMIVFHNGERKFVIQGTPGIGKTFFGYYMIYKLLSEPEGKDRVIIWEHWEHRKKRFRITRESVTVGSSLDNVNDDFDDDLGNITTWYIVDGKPVENVSAITVLLSSPVKRNSKAFRKHDLVDRYMPVWTKSELQAACQLGLAVNSQGKVQKFKGKVARLYKQWGGVPRQVFYQGKRFVRSRDEDERPNIDELIAKVDIKSLHDLPTQLETDLHSHRLFHLRVRVRSSGAKNGLWRYSSYQVIFASYYVAERLFARYNLSHRQYILTMVDEHVQGHSPKLGDISGTSFEGVAHQMLCCGGEFRVRALDCKSSPVEIIMLPPLRLTFFSHDANNKDKVKRITDVKTDRSCYYVPQGLNFAAADSLRYPDQIFQMTVSKKHPEHMETLDLIVKHLQALYASDENSQSLNNVQPSMERHSRKGQLKIALYFVVPSRRFARFEEQEYTIGKRVNRLSESVTCMKANMYEHVKQYALEIPYTSEWTSMADMSDK